MHPLAAPGALWVLSRAGKVPRPPAGGRNLSQETHSLWKAGERAFLAFPVLQGFAPAGATRGLSDRPLDPFGAHPHYIRGAKPLTRNTFLVEGRGKSPLCFPVSQGFAPAGATRGLSDRPLDPFGAHPYIRGRNLSQGTRSLWRAGESPLFAFLFRRGFRLCGGDQRAFRSPFGNLRVNMLWRST